MALMLSVYGIDRSASITKGHLIKSVLCDVMLGKCANLAFLLT